MWIVRMELNWHPSGKYDLKYADCQEAEIFVGISRTDFYQNWTKNVKNEGKS